MCGIVGYIGGRDAQEVILKGLSRLEYRGYDSAGVAIIDRGKISVRKKEGKLAGLAELLAASPLRGHTGVGHTRWATHGEPDTPNAHPHTDCTGRLAMVHNGIIENYAILRAALAAEGHRFS